MVSASPVLGGVLLVGAGIYELTPYKHACLDHCRAPAHFISQRWRRGLAGAFRMGLELGAYCVGCCWILMGLLFVGGFKKPGLGRGRHVDAAVSKPDGQGTRTVLIRVEAHRP